MYCDVCVNRKTCYKILGASRNVPHCFSPYGAIKVTKEIDCSREYYWVSGFHKDFPDIAYV